MNQYGVIASRCFSVVVFTWMSGVHFQLLHVRVATLFWFVISNKVQPAKSTSPSGGMARCYKGHRQTSYLVPHHLFFSPRIYYFAERLQSFVFQIDCIKFV